MGKIFTVLVISVCAASTCFALGLELSDVIKEAREIERAKLSQNQTEEKSIKPVNSECKSPLSKDKEEIPNKTK